MGLQYILKAISNMHDYSLPLLANPNTYQPALNNQLLLRLAGLLVFLGCFLSLQQT